jgi:hypothetical protein
MGRVRRRIGSPVAYPHVIKKGGGEEYSVINLRLFGHAPEGARVHVEDSHNGC